MPNINILIADDTTLIRQLLAHQLGNAHSGCRLDGKIVQQDAVIGGVILLAHVRAKVEQPHQFTVASTAPAPACGTRRWSRSRMPNGTAHR